MIINDVRFLLVQQAETTVRGKHVIPLGHIILILGQSVFALSPQCCVLRGEASNSNFIVFGFTRPWHERTIYHTRCEHTTYGFPRPGHERTIYHTLTITPPMWFGMWRIETKLPFVYTDTNVAKYISTKETLLHLKQIFSFQERRFRDQSI